MMNEINSGWNDEAEDVLERLRINCVNLSEYHRKRYYHFKSYGKYFRLPLIILASVNSTVSIGLTDLLAQRIISGITCLIGMTMGIIGAVELYLGIQNSMELELKQSKEFYVLAIDLYKSLSLRRENRSDNGKEYLNEKYSQYIKMVEASNLLQGKMKADLLTTIPSSCVYDNLREINYQTSIIKRHENIESAVNDLDSLVNVEKDEKIESAVNDSDSLVNVENDENIESAVNDSDSLVNVEKDEKIESAVNDSDSLVNVENEESITVGINDSDSLVNVENEELTTVGINDSDSLVNVDN
ncbi:hypothetical protein N9K75_02665 [bacterium]|nr:hypothetical protein [bacterium]